MADPRQCPKCNGKMNLTDAGKPPTPRYACSRKECGHTVRLHVQGKRGRLDRDRERLVEVLKETIKRMQEAERLADYQSTVGTVKPIKSLMVGYWEKNMKRLGIQREHVEAAQKKAAQQRKEHGDA